jgi:hypothetical protein
MLRQDHEKEIEKVRAVKAEGAQLPMDDVDLELDHKMRRYYTLYQEELQAKNDLHTELDQLKVQFQKMQLLIPNSPRYLRVRQLSLLSSRITAVSRVENFLKSVNPNKQPKTSEEEEEKERATIPIPFPTSSPTKPRVSFKEPEEPQVKNKKEASLKK